MKICLIAIAPIPLAKGTQKILAPYLLKTYCRNHLEKNSDLVIKIIDVSFDTPIIETVERITEFQPDMVGFSMYAWNLRESTELIKALKEKNNHLLILTGGPSVAYNAEEILHAYPSIDIVCLEHRRGEIVFTDIVQCLMEKKSLNNVMGIVFRSDNQQIVKTGPVEDQIDFSIENSPYIMGDIDMNDDDGSYIITLETSRGCPFDCGYCLWGSQNQHLDFLPIERVLEEIKLIYNDPRVTMVLFADSYMSLKKSRLMKILTFMEEQKYFSDILTRMYLHIDSIDGEITMKLSRIPNFELSFGLQTAHMESLLRISTKRPLPQRFRDKIAEMRKVLPNIAFTLDIMMGLPGDNLEGFKETLNFCLSLEPKRLYTFYPIILLPGTRFYKERHLFTLQSNENDVDVIVCTEDFPVAAIEKALRLTLWIQILTYNYKAIGQFFYAVCREANANLNRIDLMEKWLQEIEKEIDLFDDKNLHKAALVSAETWARVKGLVIEKAASFEVGYKIYSVIYSLHKGNTLDLFKRTIEPGMKIYSYCLEKKYVVTARETRQLILTQFNHDYTVDEIDDLFCIGISKPK